MILIIDTKTLCENNADKIKAVEQKLKESNFYYLILENKEVNENTDSQPKKFKIIIHIFNLLNLIQINYSIKRDLIQILTYKF